MHLSRFWLIYGVLIFVKEVLVLSTKEYKLSMDIYC